MLRVSLVVATWLAALVVAAPALAGNGDNCVEPVARAIQSRYEAVRDLRARFDQSTRSVALGSSAARTTNSSGNVVFAKPGKMRWSYEKPEPSLVVSDGVSLWIYDPGLGEAQKLPVGEGYLSGAAVQFLLGEGDMLRDFAVTPVSCAPDSATLELVPRAPASYERLRVVAVPGTGELLQTEITDLLGNVTRIAFRDVETNVGPAASTFVFQAPEGVRVIEVEAGSP